MPHSFVHTTRALRDQRGGAPSALMLIGLLLFCAGWGYWATHASVPIYATSAQARLVSKQEPVVVQAQAEGPLVEIVSGVATPVAEAQVLARVDGRKLSLELEQQRALLKLIDEVEQPALKRQIELLEASMSQGATLSARIKESEAQLQESIAAERHAKEELKRQEMLLSVGAQTEAGISAQRALVERLAQGVTRWRSTISRVRGEGGQERRAFGAEVAKLEQAQGTLSRERAALVGSLSQLELALSRYQLTAPISGTLTSPTPRPQVGAIVTLGQPLAIIVPDGPVIVEATFDPKGLSGRVAKGQRAKLRLDAFVWTRYGELELEVIEVAREPVDGLLYVRAALIHEAKLSPQLRRHGLTGRIEVAIEQLTPWALLLRQLGQRLDGPAEEPSL